MRNVRKKTWTDQMRDIDSVTDPVQTHYRNQVTVPIWWVVFRNVNRLVWETVVDQARESK